jgi:molecular chaperone DnaJ
MVRTGICDLCDGEGRVAQQPCKACGGRGRKVERTKLSVDVPAGIGDGQRIRIAGRGHAGERGGPAGDLYVQIRVREDSRFVRDGDDLVTVVDVAAPLAALGTTVQVPTLDGTIDLEVPPGTQPHEILLVRGAGIPALRGRRTGDLRVVVNVVVPRRLKREQRELLEELAESMTEDNLRTDEGVFGKLRRAFGG